MTPTFRANLHALVVCVKLNKKKLDKPSILMYDGYIRKELLL
jgi:hypothetical protein